MKEYLILSTIPHVGSILPLLPYYQTYTYGYVHTVLLSTMMSVLYHFYEESTPWVTRLDYFFAGIWFLYDLHLCRPADLSKILAVNCISAFLNIQIPYDDSYTLYHSLWHLLNAAKAYYVSTLLADGLHTKRSREPSGDYSYAPEWSRTL